MVSWTSEKVAAHSKHYSTTLKARFSGNILEVTVCGPDMASMEGVKGTDLVEYYKGKRGHALNFLLRLQKGLYFIGHEEGTDEYHARAHVEFGDPPELIERPMKFKELGDFYAEAFTALDNFPDRELGKKLRKELQEFCSGAARNLNRDWEQVASANSIM